MYIVSWTNPSVSIEPFGRNPLSTTIHRGGKQTGQWGASGLAGREFGLSETPSPPHSVKNNQHFNWLSRQTGALREYYLSAMFVQHPEKTRACFVYMQGDSRNSEIISLFCKESHKMWQICRILWLHIKAFVVFQMDRQKFPIIFILFNADWWIHFKSSLWISCREIFLQKKQSKKEWMIASFIRTNSRFLWGQIYVCRHVTKGNICSMYSHFWHLPCPLHLIHFNIKHRRT